MNFSLTWKLVAVEQFDYDFVDVKSNERKQGSTYSVTVSSNKSLVRLKTTKEVYDKLIKLPDDQKGEVLVKIDQRQKDTAGYCKLYVEWFQPDLTADMKK